MRKLLSFVVGMIVLLIFVVCFGQAPTRRYLLSISGTLDVNYPGVPTACWNFDATVAGTYTDDCASTYLMTVNGSPTKVTGDGTWPAGLSASQGSAWKLDGSSDYLSMADGSGGDTFDPAGDFSIQCVITTSSIEAGQSYLVTKWNATGNQRGWVIYRSAANLSFSISSDGVTSTYNSIATVLDANRPTFFTHVYDYVSDGSSVSTFYVDNLATDTDSLQKGPAYNNTADFVIGGTHATPSWAGNIANCIYWDGIKITEAQHDAMYAQWDGRTSMAGGNVFVDVSSASSPAVIIAPPDSGTEPFLVDMPANSIRIGSPASGSGGVCGAAAIANLAQRAKFRTCTQNSNTEPDGWTVTETAGGGASDVSCSTTQVAHDKNAIKMATTAADSSGQITSACINIDDTKDYYFSVWAYGGAGDEDFRLRLNTWTDDACTAGAATVDLLSEVNLAEGWSKHGSVRSSGDWGTAESVKMDIGVITIATTVYFSAPQARQASNPTDAFCGCDTDAPCACNHVVTSDNNPLTAGTWQFEGIIRSPIDGAVGTPNRYILYVPATSGDANKIQMYWAGDTLNCRVYDSGGTLKSSSVAAAGNANTDYSIKMYHTADGRVGCCWEGTCDSTEATGALMDGINATIYFAYDGSAAADAWIKDPLFLRRLR